MAAGPGQGEPLSQPAPASTWLWRSLARQLGSTAGTYEGRPSPASLRASTAACQQRRASGSPSRGRAPPHALKLPARRRGALLGCSTSLGGLGAANSESRSRIHCAISRAGRSPSVARNSALFQQWTRAGLRVKRRLRACQLFPRGPTLDLRVGATLAGRVIG